MELYYDEKNLIVASVLIVSCAIASYITSNWWILLSSIILTIELWIWVGIYLIKHEDKLPPIKSEVSSSPAYNRKVKVYCTRYFGMRGNDYNFYLDGERIAKIPKGGISEIPISSNPVNLGVQSTGLEINNYTLNLTDDDELYVIGNNNHDNLPHTDLRIIKDISEIDESQIRSDHEEFKKAIVSSRLLFFAESSVVFIIIIVFFNMI